MRTRSRSAAAVLGAALILMICTAFAAPAWAHEGRGVGDHEFVVGFGTEPAYSGFPNSVQLVISHHDGEPVEEIDGTLQAEVTFGEASETYDLEPNFEVGEFGEVGDFRAWFIPSRPGQYTFRIFGTMEGEKIDETFVSGKGFSDVEDTSSASFPTQDPNTGELSDKLDRENARLTAELTTAQDDASSARTIALIGIAVGAIGIVLAAVALATRKKR